MVYCYKVLRMIKMRGQRIVRNRTNGRHNQQDKETQNSKIIEGSANRAALHVKRGFEFRYKEVFVNN